MARGGMGEVFRAVALGPDGEEVPVAIKRIVPMHAGSDDLRQLFIAEASMMTRLKHPNIDEVLDFGVDEAGDFYLVLELVSGTDLGRLCKGLWARGESVPVPIALFVAAQVLEGLGYAHERSAAEGRLMVHRDVSPGNVLISLSGVVKIADFGVAIATRGEVGDAARRDLVGKPSYMPPEQFDGERVDARADVFALGVVLFQMLTGTRPFPGSSAASRMAAAREGQMLRASELRPEVSPALEAILARALAPRRDDRFPDARAMLEAIGALREAGHEIGTPEDLGALVSAALKESPESRPPGPHTPELPEDEDDLEGGELTRADADSPFTLRATRRPGPSSQVLGGEAEALDALDALDGIDAALPAPSSAPVSGGFHAVAPASGEESSLDPLQASSLRGAVSLTPRPRDEARPPSSAPGAVLPPAGATRQRLLAAAIACVALAGIAVASVRVGRGGPSAASPAAVQRAVRAVQPQITAAVQAALLPLRRAPSPASPAEGAAPAAGSAAGPAPAAGTTAGAAPAAVTATATATAPAAAPP